MDLQVRLESALGVIRRMAGMPRMRNPKSHESSISLSHVPTLPSGKSGSFVHS